MMDRNKQGREKQLSTGYKAMPVYQENLSGLVLISLLMLALLPGDVSAASPQVVKAAEQEGKVVYSTTMSVQETDRVLRDFKKKYPRITAESFRLTKEKLVTRLLAEDAANRTTADVVSVNDMVMELLRLKGVLGQYDNPEAAVYGPGFKEKNGYWTGLYGPTAVIVYNSRLVKPEDVPKSYDDLLLPRWKGKMGMDGTKWEWFAAQLQIMGQEKGMTFMKKLVAQNLQFRTGITLLTQLTAAGEFPLIVYGYAHSAEEFISRGAPIGWVPVQPIFMNMVGVGLTAHAPHPNAARLLVEYLTSKEGQGVISSMHRVPVRPDVPADPPRLTQGLKFFSLKPETAENYRDFEKLFLKTFLGK